MSVKPVAWMYHYHEGVNHTFSLNRRPELLGWIETPLYSAPAPELAEALEILTAACEKEFISPVTERGELPCADDDSVMGGLDGESPITFGMIRAARKLLARIIPK